MLVVAAAGVAYANVPSGNASQSNGPAFSNGYESWNAGPETMYVQVAASGTFNSGWCLDAWFDWTRPGGHFDARVARTCRSSIQSQGSSSDGNNGLTGMQKAATCYGPNQNTTRNNFNCVEDEARAGGQAGTTAGNVNPSLPNNCTRSWRINAGQTQIIYGAGGSKTSCTS